LSAWELGARFTLPILSCGYSFFKDRLENWALRVPYIYVDLFGG